MAKKPPAADPLTVAIADTQARYDAALAAHQALQRDAQAINARGVELERTILGLIGELAALQRLSDGR